MWGKTTLNTKSRSVPYDPVIGRLASWYLQKLEENYETLKECPRCGVKPKKWAVACPQCRYSLT